MKRPNPETVTLNDILITEELSRRASRPPNLQAENQAMRMLIHRMTQDVESLMQTSVDTALELCRAGTTGLSLLETTADGEEIFRWNALAGTLAHHVGSTTPRNFSPCGVCLEQGAPVLFSHPERYFTYFQDDNTSIRAAIPVGIVEGLVLPLVADRHVFGTIWMMSHDEQRQFDSEDVRVMTSLADFTATALLLQQRQTGELLAANAVLEAEIVERKQVEAQTYALVANLPGGAVFVVDRDLRYLLAEGEAFAAAGFKPEDFVGRTIFEVLPPDLAASYEPMYRQALAGEPFEHEHYAHNHTYLSRGTPLRTAPRAEAELSPGSDVYAVLVVSFDITERKRAEAERQEAEAALRKLEERQVFLLTLNDALRSLADPVEIQEIVTRTAMNYFGADRCYYCEIKDGNAIILRDAARGKLPSVAGVYPLSSFPMLQAVNDAGRPFVVQDVHTTHTVDDDLRQLCIQLQLISYVDVPVIKQGKPVGVLCLVQSTPREWTDLEVELAIETADLTWAAVERAYVEAALRESEAKYRSLFESINDAFALIEVLYDTDDRPVDCRFLEVSPSFEVHTGLTQAQDRTLKELIPSIEPAWFEYYHQALVTNDRVHIEMLQEYLNIWFEVDVFPYGNPQDRRVTIIFRNINDRKQAEANQMQLMREQAAREQERQRAETLAELDRAKTLFFSNVSHEFRTPLTLSLTPLQDALSDRTLPLIHRERLELVHRNNLRLLKLVNTLLDFSRIEAGRMEAVYEPTDLAMFTTELTSVFRSEIERAGLRLIVDCPPLPEPVYVDREMWEKIVLNLLSNALKFTFEGEIRVNLRVDGWMSESVDENSSTHRPIDPSTHQPPTPHAILQIRDTGTGIAPEHLPHLFERFYQVRGTQARTHEGSGIGLALVYELVGLHGGSIDVSSIVGEDTCFTIALQFGTNHLPQERIHATRTLASTAMGAASYIEEAERWLPPQTSEVFKTSEVSPPPRASARVLLVDDNADMREYLTRILSEHVQVEAVADGASALAVAQARVPDLVLSDVMMPGLDGFELIGALRADPRIREIPIILLSARAGEEAVIEGLEAGADDYLIKPFSAQELVSRVTAHLQMAHLRGEVLQQERIMNRQKDEFISVVSHELNIPLVSILGWTRVLQGNLPNPVMLSKALDTIERNATLQGKLVQDLLDLSRITAGKLRLNPQPIELQPVIETAIATIAQVAADKGIYLTWRENVTEPVVVMGDSHRLQQVICNLLANAIKFTPEDGQVEISLSLVIGFDVSAQPNDPWSLVADKERMTNDHYAEIRVMDTGAGITSDFLPYVFERFRQAEGAHSVKGLGLGLAIAHHIVELHNGTIRAESAGERQGATFIVRVPLLENDESYGSSQMG